jgi:mRNA interferase MazF
MPRAYVPEAGEVVWLEYDPQTGCEQAGQRPALAISLATYNRKSGLMVCCPMTTRLKGYRFEELTHMEGVECAARSDQVKSLDWRASKARKKSSVPPETMLEVRAKIKALLQIV